MTEEIIKNAFMSIFNDMVDNMDAIVAFVDATIQTLLKTDSLDKKIALAKCDADAKLKVLQDYIPVRNEDCNKIRGVRPQG